MSCCSPDAELTTSVQDYYGKVLKESDDLLTTACKTPTSKLPKYIREALAEVHDEVVKKYYGCGIVVPHCLSGMNVVDLGSGSGRDCYALSKLVGSSGYVIGVDMTDEQLKVANDHIEYHRTKFNYENSNVKFVKGFIEDLKDVGIKDNSIDIVISNCVVNLCEDKKKVFNEVYRVLKNGGEFFFSDVYCDRKLDESIRKHQVLWNECVSGALSWEELNEMALEAGFETPRIFEAHSFDITKPDLKAVVGDAKFVSVVYRLFKLDPTNKCDENQQVIYDGGIEGCDEDIQFDYKKTFKTGEATTIHSDTWNIIKQSRMAGFFESRKAPSCAKPAAAIVENPFKVVEEGGVSSGGGGGCC